MIRGKKNSKLIGVFTVYMENKESLECAPYKASTYTHLRRSGSVAAFTRLTPISRQSFARGLNVSSPILRASTDSVSGIEKANLELIDVKSTNLLDLT